MRIAEIYRSLQGEGFLTGTDSVFVRVSGCNLRCWFCDTPYTSWEPEGDDFSVEEIIASVTRLAARHVVITGGEPLLFAELIPLCARLHELGQHLTLETAGTLCLPLACDLMSISPKLSNSTPSAQLSAHWHERHERARHQPDVIRQLVRDYPYQFKFVVSDVRDCEEVARYLHELPEISRERVLLMPEGTDQVKLTATAQWLQPYCETHGFHFCPRKHIEWYGAIRGT